MSPAGSGSATHEDGRRERMHALLARPSSSGRLRLLVAAGAGLVVGGMVSVAAVPRYGVLVGLMVTSAAYVVWSYLALRGFSGRGTKQHARQEDTGSALTTVGVGAVIACSLAAVVTLLVRDRSGSASTDALLAVGGVLFAWFLLHTLYVGRYARLFYSDDPDKEFTRPDQPTRSTEHPHPPVVAGIDFNDPGYWPTYGDFTYFAFNLGMTFQVSDTSVSEPRIRRLVLEHCLLSYFFATAITASVINLVLGLAS